MSDLLALGPNPDPEDIISVLLEENHRIKSALVAIHHVVASMQVVKESPKSIPVNMSNMMIDEIIDILKWHLGSKEPSTDTEAESKLRGLVVQFEQHECSCGECQCGEEKDCEESVEEDT